MGTPGQFFANPPEVLHPHRRYAPPNWLVNLAAGVVKEPPPTCAPSNLVGNIWPKLNLRPPTPCTLGGGEMYSPTGWVPMHRESLRRAPHPHALPPRREPLAKFVPTAAHTTHPGGGNIYSPTGRVPERRESTRIPHHLHDFPPLGGNPWQDLGHRPRTPSPIREYPWKKLAHGGHPKPTSAGMQPGGEEELINLPHREGG